MTTVSNFGFFVEYYYNYLQCNSLEKLVKNSGRRYCKSHNVHSIESYQLQEEVIAIPKVFVKDITTQPSNVSVKLTALQLPCYCA